MKQLTEKEFDLIKTLQDAELRAVRTAEIVKRSNSTVGVVYKSETMAEYKEKIRVRTEEHRNGTLALTPEEPASESQPLISVVEVQKMMKLILTQLDEINGKVTWVEENAVVKRKGIFG